MKKENELELVPELGRQQNFGVGSFLKKEEANYSLEPAGKSNKIKWESSDNDILGELSKSKNVRRKKEEQQR